MTGDSNWSRHFLKKSIFWENRLEFRNSEGTSFLVPFCKVYPGNLLVKSDFENLHSVSKSTLPASTGSWNFGLLTMLVIYTQSVYPIYPTQDVKWHPDSDSEMTSRLGM